MRNFEFGVEGGGLEGFEEKRLFEFLFGLDTDNFALGEVLGGKKRVGFEAVFGTDELFRVLTGVEFGVGFVF